MLAIGHDVRPCRRSGEILPQYPVAPLEFHILRRERRDGTPVGRRGRPVNAPRSFDVPIKAAEGRAVSVNVRVAGVSFAGRLGTARGILPPSSEGAADADPMEAQAK
jgi:hypothetical protein